MRLRVNLYFEGRFNQLVSVAKIFSSVLNSHKMKPLNEFKLDLIQSNRAEVQPPVKLRNLKNQF